VRGRATDREAQGRSDDGTAGTGKPELAGVGAAQTAEGQRKHGRVRRFHRKVRWGELGHVDEARGRNRARGATLVSHGRSSRSWQKRGTLSQRRRDEEPQERRTRASAQAGELKTAKAARAVHPGSTLKGSRTSGEGSFSDQPGNGRSSGRWSGRERPRSPHSREERTGRGHPKQ
jgi:hypothetical protein